MINAYITLFVALMIATIAGWFSIAGLMALYAAATIPILLMGAVLECGKLITASWLYRNWEEPWSFKTPGIVFVIVLMIITSMGIFGFLSKAHTEQDGPVNTAHAKIERLEANISREQRIINDADVELAQLDKAIDILIQYDKISGPDGARAVRAQQKPERDKIKQRQKETQQIIDSLTDKKFELEQIVRDFEKEIGPVKYIAALIYKDPTNNIDSAIRIVTMMLIFVFDPLAVWLLIAANRSLLKLEKTTHVEKEKESTDTIQQTTKKCETICVQTKKRKKPKLPQQHPEATAKARSAKARDKTRQGNDELSRDVEEIPLQTEISEKISEQGSPPTGTSPPSADATNSRSSQDGTSGAPYDTTKPK